MDAVDNVVLIATMSEDNDEAIKAVVGVFGKDALACAPTCELLFKDPIKAVKESSDRMMENLIKLHTKEETKH